MDIDPDGDVHTVKSAKTLGSFGMDAPSDLPWVPEIWDDTHLPISSDESCVLDDMAYGCGDEHVGGALQMNTAPVLNMAAAANCCSPCVSPVADCCSLPCGPPPQEQEPVWAAKLMSKLDQVLTGLDSAKPSCASVSTDTTTSTPRVQAFAQG